MTFETMCNALDTLAIFRARVIRLYSVHHERSDRHDVRCCLQQAIRRELREQRHFVEAREHVVGKCSFAHFKWHDRRLLLRVPEVLDSRQLHDCDDVVELVTTCDQALDHYCRGLLASTNSVEVEDFITSLRDRRNEAKRNFVRQAMRGIV